MNNYILYIFLGILIISNVAMLFILLISRKEILYRIGTSIEPKFLEIAISPETNKIINLGIDTWRLESRLNELINISELEKEKIENSLNRVKKYTTDYNFEIKEFTGEKYSEEINIYELKATENTNNKVLDGIIKDTIEPAVINNGNIIKQAKIIVYKFTS